MKIITTSLRNIIGAAVVISVLGGCAATQVAISKKDLDVQARTSTAIFVDPVSREKRTIYLEIKSGVMEFNRGKFKQFVLEQFAQFSDGYKVIDDPDAAQYQMIVYVLNLEKTSPTAAQAALNQGYVGSGTIIAGATAGALLSQSNPVAGGFAGGLIAGVGGLVADSFVKDVTFMLVSDVQIKEKAAAGVIGKKDSRIDTKISDAGSSQQTFSEATNKKEYRTRIVTTANQVNLKIEAAEDQMFKKTAYAMAGFF